MLAAQVTVCDGPASGRAGQAGPGTNVTHFSAIDPAAPAGV
jgi:hypothetical protein